MKSLQGALSIAQTDFTGAAAAAKQSQAETQKPDPGQVERAVRDADAAQQRLSGAQSQVNGAQHELDLAKQLAEQARQMRDGAARTCTREIEDASDAGIQPRSFWQKLGDALKALWDIICEVAKWVALVAGIIGMILGGPLAWIALAAGAILLIKAIVDFAQGKGSVLDLVFGILGVIPGVKGLTTLSKLSALYKAGGVKAIAKATLTGMKTMATDMVKVVKAAGEGAVTIVKNLAGASGSVLTVVKASGVKLVDTITAGAKLFPGGSPKPVPAKGFGMPQPHPVGGGGGATKTFTEQFNDLAALKPVEEQIQLTKLKNDFQAKFDAEKLGIENAFPAKLQGATAKISADYAEKLRLGKIDIENKSAADLKLKVDAIKTDIAPDGMSAAKFDELKATKTAELQAGYGKQFDAQQTALKQAHDAKAAGLDQQIAAVDQQGRDLLTQYAKLSGADATDFVRANQPAWDALDASHKALQADKLKLADGLKADVADLTTSTTKLAEADLSAYLKQVHVDEITKNLDAAKAQDIADLTAKLDGARLGDIATETTRLDGIKAAEITAADQKFTALHNAEVPNVTAQVDANYKALHDNLNLQMLDSVAQDVPLSTGGTAKVLHLDPNGPHVDFDTVVAKNLPDLNAISPNKTPFDVHCTKVVQSLDQYVKTGVATVAPKINAPQELHTIEANYNGLKFKPAGSYDEIVTEMASRPPGTVGIVGFRGPTVSGHVLNVVNMGGGRIGFIDGQTGRLGYLPPLTNINLPGGDELKFMPTS